VTQPLPPPIPELIPDSAPFTPEQRTWLNGFFAGLISLDGAGVTPLSPEQSAALMPAAPGAATNEFGDTDDGEAPWHDQTMPIADRLKLASQRPLRRRMMAAMAQQDCGQCGYNCEDYSNAIFTRKEERLNLCVPGGKETARMLKKLFEEFDAAPAVAVPAVVASPAEPAPAAEAGTSRDHPAVATLVSRARLNKKGSQKETWHVEFDLAASGLDYAVGDSFGVFAHNEPALVDAVMRAIGAKPDAPVGGRHAHPALPRLVARQHREVLRPGPHAPGRARPVDLDRRGRASLRVRRRQAHGQGRRARARGHRRPVRRPLDRRGRELRRGSQEEGQVPARRLLMRCKRFQSPSN